jgi:hypothetical protein
MVPAELTRKDVDRASGDWVALSSPAPRSNFTVLVEQVARGVRAEVDAVLEASKATSSAYRAVLGPRLSHLGFDPATVEEPVLAARALVAIWLSGYALGRLSPGDSFAEAEHWFLGSAASSLPPLASDDLCPLFPQLPPPAEVFALLPYILDPLAPGTRRSVRQRPDESEDRRQRKKAGVYYTPGDVAAHMVTSAAPDTRRSCLDPTCGTGVFLRAAFLKQRAGFTGLFGVDADPFAADAVAFVLATAALHSGEHWPSPWSAWQAARMRVATLDSLLLLPGVELDARSQRLREQEFNAIHQTLVDGVAPAEAKEQQPFRALGSLFPPLRKGSDLIVSNPPYTALGPRPPLDPISSRFTSLRSSGVGLTTRVEGLFVELAWQLLSAQGALSLVLPLSVATSSRPEFVGLREAMQKLQGAWTISFFDRAPDALFGDDIKTRNTIFTFRREARSSVSTTRLLRWTSWTRESFFSSFAWCDAEFDIGPFIPKVGLPAEARLLKRLQALPSTLGATVTQVTNARPGAGASRGASTVFVAPTAYNWLGCARDLDAFLGNGHTSESNLTAMHFPTPQVADAAFAVIASRLTFWLWNVKSDGFHVTRTFLRDLPFDLHRLGERERCELAEAGRHLWSTMRESPVISINKGRTTVAFSPLSGAPFLDLADQALLAAFGLGTLISPGSIRAWHENHVVVDLERRDPVPLLKKGQKRAA